MTRQIGPVPGSPGGIFIPDVIDIQEIKHPDTEEEVQRRWRTEKHAFDFDERYRFNTLYDSFTRANSTSLAATEGLDSRPWYQAAGTCQIFSNTMSADVLDASGEAMALAPLGYQEFVEFWAVGTNNAGVAGNDAWGIVFRAASSRDLLLVEIAGDTSAAPNGALSIWKKVANVYTNLVSVQFGAAMNGNTNMYLHVVATGPIIYAECRGANDGTGAFDAEATYDTEADTWTSILKAGHYIGPRFTRIDQESVTRLSARTF